MLSLFPDDNRYIRSMIMELRAALISNVVAPQPVIVLLRMVFVGISLITSESHSPFLISISQIDHIKILWEAGGEPAPLLYIWLFENCGYIRHRLCGHDNFSIGK